MPGETPQQRVARLKEVLKAKKRERITLMDKLYVHGRAWADIMHRVTAFGLIGATSRFALGVGGICGLIVVICDSFVWRGYDIYVDADDYS